MKSKPAETNNSIDDYIKKFPEDTQHLLNQIRATIQKTAPQAAEKIAYGIPTYHYNGNLVHFAAFKNHIGFFPTPSAIEAFQKQLKPYKTSKGAIQLPMTDPLPRKLIELIVIFRLKQNSRR
jgi:uncharacterized protein YdhG (YjbR/CyaY superfamily)